MTIAAPPPNIVNTTYWSNDGTSNGGSAPASAVPLGVTSGLYSLALGDPSLANMTAALPASVFDNPDVRLRVWFDDATHGSQLLSPDQRFGTVPYAFRAALAQTVPAGAITSAQLADGAVSGSKLAAGAVGTAQIASGALTPTQLFTSSGPQSGQVLSFDGTKFNWITSSGGGGGGSFTLPYSGIASGTFGGSLFHVSSTTPTLGYGIEGESQNGPGIFGHSPNSDGVLGQSDGYYGVRGETTAVNHSGVYGYTSASGSAGVEGASSGNGPALRAFNLVGSGVGLEVSSSSSDGIDATTAHASKSAVYAHTATANAYGLYAISNQYTALAAQTQGATQTAGFFWNTAGGDAIRTTGNLKVTGDANVTGDCIANGILGTNTFLAVNGAASFSGNVTVNATTTTRVLTITGGADVAEPFVIVGDAEIPKGSVVVIDAGHPGKLARSLHPYDKCVAGIVSGANGIHPGIALHQDGMVEGGQDVALNGRVYVLAEASDGPIRPGDLLTTSSTPGHAMKVTDHDRAQGAVLGKAMSFLDEGTGYVLVLVTLQ